jgi:hypothetical protein
VRMMNMVIEIANQEFVKVILLKLWVNQMLPTLNHRVLFKFFHGYFFEELLTSGMAAIISIIFKNLH